MLHFGMKAKLIQLGRSSFLFIFSLEMWRWELTALVWDRKEDVCVRKVCSDSAFKVVLQTLVCLLGEKLWLWHSFRVSLKEVQSSVGPVQQNS